MDIPFVDLFAQYQAYKDEIDHAIYRVINETAFIGGKYVANFEKEFASALGVKHCIGVANGTDALYIALNALEIKDGDEVITTAHSWIASSEAISQAGGIPVFVDEDEDLMTIDSSQIEKHISSRTKAIIPVHLAGQAVDMDALMDLSRKNNLYIIEDCAQAHLTTYKQNYVGNFGNLATFSFYPGKNLGAYGDAGCIVTNNDHLAEFCRKYANHGALKKHFHEMEGINSRLDGLQASILSAKLPHLYQWTKERQKKANYYNAHLENTGDLKLPQVHPNCDHSYHLYIIQTDYRDYLKQFLTEKGIGTAIHYPTALPFLPAYNYLHHQPEDFPVAHRLQNKMLSLPLYPEITVEQQNFVIDKIKEFYNSKGVYL